MKRLIIAILFLIAPQANFAMDKNNLFQDDDNDSVFGSALQFDSDDEDLRIANPPRTMHLMPAPDDDLDEDQNWDNDDWDIERLLNSSQSLHVPTIINANTNNDRITNAADDPSHNPNFVATTQSNPIASAPLNNQQQKFCCPVPGCERANKPYSGSSPLIAHMQRKHSYERFYCRKPGCEKNTHAYSSLHALQKHVIKKHPNNQTEHHDHIPNVANDLNHNPDSGLLQINQPASNALNNDLSTYHTHGSTNDDQADRNAAPENAPKRIRLQPDGYDNNDPSDVSFNDILNMDGDHLKQWINSIVNPLPQHDLPAEMVNPNQNDDRITNAANDRSHDPHFGLAAFAQLGAQLRRGLHQYENNKSV